MKIKNILAILSLGMVSCVGLEQYPTTSYTDETFWTIEDNVRTALYLGYNQCWHQDYYFANNLLSDDVYGSRHSTNETSIVTGMANTSNGRFSDEWDKCYQELRTIHTALDAQDRMNIDETFKTRMLAELRLMRAFTYLRLVTWFGDVPFFTTNPTLPESRVVKVTPAATIKEFIHSELAEVAEILPKNTDIPESENGRYTRGTAVALNARAYLYDNDFENCAIWCDKLINSTEYGTYALEQDYKKLFHDQSCCYGPESIMTIEFATLGGIDNIVRSWNNFNAFVPQSIGNKGVTTQSPTQELVDQYENVKYNSSTALESYPVVDLALPYRDNTHLNPNFNPENTIFDQVSNPYGDRDPRFYVTVVYNECVRTAFWKNEEIDGRSGVHYVGNAIRSKTIWTNKDDDYTGVHSSRRQRTRTGYYLNKYLRPSEGENAGGSVKGKIFRLAEIILNTAECAINAGHIQEGMTLVNEIRDRAGMPAWPTSLTQDEALLYLKHERRVEMAMEDTRLDDMRRWQRPDGDMLDYQWPTAMEISWLGDDKEGKPMYTYTRKHIRNSPRRCYSNKWLWVPIPLSDQNRLETLTGHAWQNPGW